MKPYRRKTAKLRVNVSRDYSKRRSYVLSDLGARVTSAIGLLLLGLVGLIFQVHTQRVRDIVEQHERESRSYLPAVRSLTELDVAFDDVATILLIDSIDGGQQTPLLPELSSRVESAATATLVFRNEPKLPVDLPDLNGEAVTTRATVGVRSAAFMLADMLRVAAIARTSLENVEPPPPSVGLVKMGNRWLAVIYRRSEILYYVSLRPEGAAAWQKWLGGQRVPLSSLLASLRAVTRSFQIETAQALQNILRTYPEFGDQYVAIRAQVLANRRKLEPIVSSKRRKTA